MRFPFQVYAPTPLDCLQHHKITNLKTIPKSYYQFPEKLHRGRDIVKFSFKSGSCQKETSQETEVAAGDKLEATGLEAARPEQGRRHGFASGGGNVSQQGAQQGFVRGP